MLDLAFMQAKQQKHKKLYNVICAFFGSFCFFLFHWVNKISFSLKDDDDDDYDDDEEEESKRHSNPFYILLGSRQPCCSFIL